MTDKPDTTDADDVIDDAQAEADAAQADADAELAAAEDDLADATTDAEVASATARKKAAVAKGAKPASTKTRSKQAKKEALKSSGTPESRRAKLQAQREEMKRKERQRRMRMYVLAGVIIALIIGLIGFVIWQANQPVKIEGAPKNATAKADGINPYPGKAKAGAPVVVVYADFQCPGCGSLENAVGKELFALAEEGEIQLEMRTMIMLDGQIPGRHSVRAAVAAACGDYVDMYPDVYRAIFSYQPPQEGMGYTDATLTDEVADLTKMSPEKKQTYVSCYNEAKTKSFVENVDKMGRKSMFDAIGENRTPVILVNGKNLDLASIDLQATDKKAMLKDAIGKVK